MWSFSGYTYTLSMCPMVLKTDLISLRIPRKYGAVLPSSSLALLTFAEEMRYSALVIFCVAATPFMRFFTSLISDIFLSEKLFRFRDDNSLVLVRQRFAVFDIRHHRGVTNPEVL